MLAEPNQVTTWPLPAQSPHSIQQRNTILTIEVSVFYQKSFKFIIIVPKIIHICLVEVIFMFFRLQNLEINQHLVYWSLVASGLLCEEKMWFTKPE